MEKTKIESIKIKVKDTTFDNAEREARKKVEGKAKNLSLIAWWDNEHQTGGPLEACGGQVPKCVRDYAQSHDVKYMVEVNKGLYEFYFSPIGPDVSELSREDVLDIHKDISKDEFDNLQGG